MQRSGNDDSALKQTVRKTSDASQRLAFRVRGLAIAVTLPLAVFLIELFLWPTGGRWSLFYPAIFVAAWFGGLVGGVLAALLSTVFMWWQFIPPEHGLIKANVQPYGAGILFLVMGVLISRAVHRNRLHAAELARYHGLLQAVLDNLPEAIVIKDLESRYLLVNKGFERLIGTTAVAVLGHTPFEVFPQPIADQVRANEETVRTTHAPSRFEVELGVGRELLVTEFPLVDEANGIFAIGAVETDISERKRGEKTLRETLDDLRTAQHVSHVGSWRWDFRTNEAKWSDELYQIFGVDPSQRPAPLVYPAAKLLTMDSLARLGAAMEQLRTDGEPFELDLEFTRPDGSTRWCAARGEAVRDAGQQIIGINGTVADITHIMELERLREEWTSIVAHDMRQPLSVISTASDFFPDAGGENTAVMLQRIQSATRSLARMVDDLMDMSLLEAHRLRLERKWIDPGALVHEAVKRLPESIGVRIKIHESGPQVTVCIDPMRLDQVMGNVLSNAVKYGDPEAAIEVRLQREVGAVEIGVTNSGKGIEPAELHRLFDRFMRLETAKASGAHGLGLGLYIAKGIVEAHGGRMWADSTPGKTTTFHITLPTSTPGQQAA